MKIFSKNNFEYMNSLYKHKQNIGRQSSPEEIEFLNQSNLSWKNCSLCEQAE